MIMLGSHPHEGEYGQWVQPPRHGVLCLLALGAAQAGGLVMARHDLIVTQKAVVVSGGPVIGVEIWLG